MSQLPMGTGNKNHTTLECVFDKIDPQFESISGPDCSLSLLLRQDGFSISIIHISSGKILRLASFVFNSNISKLNNPAEWPANGTEYSKLLFSSEFFLKKYGQVYVAADSFKFTTAPYNFLQLDKTSEIISASHEMRTDEDSFIEPVFDLGPAIATVLPKYVSDLCEKAFPNSILRSAPAVFIKGVIRQNSQLITRQVFINMHHDYFEIAAIQGLRLQYLNAFKYSAPSDVLYYVVFILEQLGLVPSEQDIVLMGNIDQDSLVVNELKMFCASVQFARNPEGMEYGEMFGEMKLHRFFTLLNIHLCE